MNIKAHPYRSKPIPIFSENQRGVALNYTKIKIDNENDLYSEKCISISELDINGANYYYRLNSAPYFRKIKGAIPNLFLRESVAKRLKNVNQKILEYGIELFLLDAYRPLSVQNFFYDEWFVEVIKKSHPNFSLNEVLKMRDRFTAKSHKSFTEVDVKAPPPHLTGAAFDLTLRFLDTKEHLFMGSIFDDPSIVSHSSYFEEKKKIEKLTVSEEEAMRNRRLLYWILKEEGFENYINEWWHFSFGDQMWAFYSGKKVAFYSKILLQS